jgi:ferredoxin
MRARVKENLCIGCGLCARKYPGLFEFDDSINAARAIPVEIVGRQDAGFCEAAAMCPSGAIQIRDLPALVEV